jgi:hypothetical protein
MPKISLPTAPVTRPTHLHEQCCTIYGRKSIGKTTLAMAYQYLLDKVHGKGERKVLNFRFEPFRQNLIILQVPTERNKKLSWPSFKEYAELFCDEEEFAVSVIDSLDKCYEACFDYVCQEHNVNHPKDAGRDAPAIWDAIKIEFESVLLSIRECGKALVFLSHEKIKIEELPDGTEYERYDLSCKPAGSAIVKSLCDYVMHYGYSGTSVKGSRKTNDRVLTVRTSDNGMEVGCNRNDHFLQPNGELVYRYKVPAIADLSDKAAKDKDQYVIDRMGEFLLAAYENELNDYEFDPEKEERQAALKRKLAARKKTAKKSTTSQGTRK